MPAKEIRLDDLKQVFAAVEAQRISYCKARQTGMIWMAAVVVALVIAIGLGLMANAPGIALIILGVCGLVALGIVLNCFFYSPFQKYRVQFKEQFIGPLIRSVADEVEYEPTGCSTMMAEYRASELYPQSVDRHKTEDMLHGRIGATDLRLSEIHTEYKTTSTDSKGNKRTSWHTIFRGLFFSADFHKDFQGSTFVKSDVAEKTFGSFGRMFQQSLFSSLQLVQLEDPDFEREFVVHTSDQVEARYILSTSMMQRMLDLKHQFSAPVEFSFVRSQMYIAISTTKDYFEPERKQSLLDDEYIKLYLQQIQLCLGVVENLGLNVRVWSKQ